MPNHTNPSLSSQRKINNTERSEISTQVYTKYEHFIAPKQFLIFFSFPEKKPPILNLNNQKSNKTSANKQTNPSSQQIQERKTAIYRKQQSRKHKRIHQRRRKKWLKGITRSTHWRESWSNSNAGSFSSSCFKTPYTSMNLDFRSLIFYLPLLRPTT